MGSIPKSIGICWIEDFSGICLTDAPTAAAASIGVLTWEVPVWLYIASQISLKLHVASYHASSDKWFELPQYIPNPGPYAAAQLPEIMKFSPDCGLIAEASPAGLGFAGSGLPSRDRDAVA